MHGPIMRPDFHEGIPFQQISGNLCFSKSWICYWPFPVGPPTKVPLPSVTHADRRRQSSVEKQRKETEFDSFTKEWRGGSSCSRWVPSLGSVLGFWPAGTGVGRSLVWAGAVVPVSAGHRVTELAAHRRHPELKGCEQRLGARPSELRRWEQPFGSKNSVVKDQVWDLFTWPPWEEMWLD